MLFPAKKGGREGKAISYESGRGVPIDVQSEGDRLVDAAARRIAVEVEVVEKQKRRKRKKSKHAGWKLRAVTIPAPDQKR